jgi:hypothetical protein
MRRYRKTSSKNDIRLIKPVRFAVKDTTHMDLLRKELDSLRYSIKEQEKTLELSKLSLNLHKRQLEKKKYESSRYDSRNDSFHNLSNFDNCIFNRAKREASSTLTHSLSVGNAQDSKNTANNNNDSNTTSIASSSQIQSTVINSQNNAINNISNSQNGASNRNSNTAISNSSTIPNIPNRYSISKSKKLSNNRHVCRVMALNLGSNAAYISFKQSNQYGIITLNMLDMHQSPIIPIHNGLVRDIKYSNGYLLSTSMDKTLKLTSTVTQESVISIPLKVPGWSCCFNETNTNKVYCGLADSSIVVYDIRNTRAYESLLCSPETLSKTPIHSMFVKSNDLGRPKIYCSNLMETFIWDNNQTLKVLDRIEGTVIKTYFIRVLYSPLSLIGYKPYSLSYSTGKTLLLSSRNQSTTKHQLISIDDSLNPTVLSTLTSPKAQKSLTKTFSFGHSSVQDTVICYSQEEPGSLCLSRSDQQLQHFKIGSCPLDIQSCNDQLAFLTDNRFFLLSPN